MTQLEQTIVNLATQSLREMTCMLDKTMSDEDRDDVITSFREASAFTQLAMLRDSGLGEEARQALERIEKEVAQTMVRLGEQKDRVGA